MSSGRTNLERSAREGQDRTPPEARLFGRRTRLVLVATTVYAAAAALRAVQGQGARAWGAALLAIAVAWVAGERERWRGLAEWGLALALASFGAAESEGWVAVLGVAGAAAAAVAANMSIGLVAAPSGIARPRRTSVFFGLAVLGVLMLVALLARVLHVAGGTGIFATQAPLFVLVSCTLAGAFLVGEAWDTARVRRLELGVAARMHAAAGLGGATAGVAWAVAFVGFAPAEPIARVALALGSVLVCHVMLRGDPVDLARASRRALALTIVGGPIVMLGAATAQGRPWDAAPVVAIVGVVALAIGASAAWIEEPLRPARGAWLDAVAAAHEALLRTDPDEAVREALVALRAPAGLSAHSPELWTFDPPHVTTVDPAGYAHGGEGTLPEGMVTTAASEPEAILRAEVLEALSVRRPELRPFARWMDDHGAMLAAVVARAGEAEGLLVLPRGKRTEALSLEEARAIKQLADGLAALCHARAALARSLARERTSTERAEVADAALGRTTRELARRAAHHTLAAERLARPATIGIYSAAARFAHEALEETVRAGRTLFVHAPAGIDAVPYVARAHLASPRRGEPLVVVDGTSSREHDAERWGDPLSSPLALADRGLLLLVDVGALPMAVQRIVARVHAEHRAPWDADADGSAELAMALAVTSRVSLAELVATGRLDPALAARLEEAGSTALPRLRERPEDLRALLSDRLAREGLRVRGVPVGIDDAAFARLLEHPFEGEDAELSVMVERLVATCDGAVVRGAQVSALLAAGASPSGDLAAGEQAR